ncbi:MAG: SWIM zinc finger family protein, partial [Pseudonocardiaceae bacterium]
MSNWFPPKSRPRAVEGGLKARGTRGAIAQTWWSERFIEVLDGIGMGNRLQRGRGYARMGQVISMDVGPGSVTAQVQGSRTRPYRVRIGIAAFGKSEWAQAEHALAGNAWYTAMLLSGEMPDDIEDVFAGLGLSLFPATAHDLSQDCSCPDHAVPCKHLAATFYLLAESFDADPFAILAWRGREREDLLANLQAARCDGPPAADRGETQGRPLTDCLGSYFTPQTQTRPPSPP